LGDVARECATTLERLLKDPLTQRILWAHARDCAPVYWTTFRYLLNSNLDRRDEARDKKSATSLSPTLKAGGASECEAPPCSTERPQSSHQQESYA
ncbi:hypothetical protein K523DRAFT_298760, partial [Schizophyllum commune Tattone D]